MIQVLGDRCIGCGVCAKACPQGVIAIVDKKAVVTDYKSCMECGACRLNCEYNAMEVTKGTGCLVAIIREDILKMTPKGTGCGCDAPGDKGSCC